MRHLRASDRRSEGEWPRRVPAEQPVHVRLSIPEPAALHSAESAASRPDAVHARGGHAAVQPNGQAGLRQERNHTDPDCVVRVLRL
eukprot:3151967-Rhodomonas_salina.1